jgi:hypothetical protein
MNLVKVNTAIKARADGDNGSGGLATLVTGVYWNQAPTGAVYPYVVFSTIHAENEDALAVAARKLVVRFAVYSKTTSTSGTVLSAIIDRILGNWLTASGRVPTYGFDRHSLNLSGGWSASPMRMTETFVEPLDQTVTQSVIEFETYISQAATNP